MADDFFKLYRTFFTGTIAEESPATRIVFLAMCDLADERGEVRATESYIQKHAHVTPEDCAAALAVLQAPDPESTTSDEEGRRVILVSANRWLVTTYSQYRGKTAKTDRRDYQRELMRVRRARERAEREAASLDSAKAISSAVDNVLAANVSIVSTKEIIKGKEKPNTRRNRYGDEDLHAKWEEFKAAYPERSQGDYEWKAARLTFDRFAKIGAPDADDGGKVKPVDPDVMIDGVKRYHASLTRRGKIGTEFVKSALVFLNKQTFREGLAAPSVDQGGTIPRMQNGVDFWIIDVGDGSGSNGYSIDPDFYEAVTCEYVVSWYERQGYDAYAAKLRRGEADWRARY